MMNFITTTIDCLWSAPWHRIDIITIENKEVRILKFIYISPKRGD